ncbi:DUF924 domain-containing protein [Shewanella psychropiezotolerans]|uniref:DUF924 domain-containing protein n=1 Tax=Shewanella psychropiezotolerans TaxID=2593655 RepID=A0ABX5WVY9_9GAMM|nr:MULTISPECIES: DUF924 family protein [Shewanella]MPY22491.1 DUF924 domain-containing protein [Shewanella sp. YLB-07]QDO83194.1 DUF924 domain-containing protein [Shewanella psychropiezotolerans]
MNSFLRQWFSQYSKGKGIELYMLSNEIKLDWFELLEQARAGQLDQWQKSPLGCLALILILGPVAFLLSDDYRNLHQRARALCISGIEKGFDTQLEFVQRRCFYDPLFCSEQLEDHKLLVLLLIGMQSQAQGDDQHAWSIWYEKALIQSDCHGLQPTA